MKTVPLKLDARLNDSKFLDIYDLKLQHESGEFYTLKILGFHTKEFINFYDTEMTKFIFIGKYDAYSCIKLSNKLSAFRIKGWEGINECYSPELAYRMVASCDMIKNSVIETSNTLANYLTAYYL